jgi:hypothetical protein
MHRAPWQAAACPASASVLAEAPGSIGVTYQCILLGAVSTLPVFHRCRLLTLEGRARTLRCFPATRLGQRDAAGPGGGTHGVGGAPGLLFALVDSVARSH